MPRRLAMACLLALLVAGCGRSRPPIRRTPPPPKTPDLALGAVETTLNVRDPEGAVVWRIKGTVRSNLAAGLATARVLDAEAVSQLPGYDAMARAGRIHYQLGDPIIRFDRRLYLVSPSRHADLEAEDATYYFKERQFEVPRRLRARYGGVVLEADRAWAKLDLRALAATTVRARQGGTTSWSARAATAHVDALNQVQLNRVTGELRQSGVATRFSAPVAVYKPQMDWLNFARGATLQRQGLTVVAEELTWQRPEGLVVTRGQTRFQRADLVAVGSGGRIDLVARTASLQNLRVTLPQAVLRAERGRVAADRTVVITGLSGLLVESGTRLTAAEAVYHPDRNELVLPQGGTALRGGERFRADQITWSGSSNRFVARGNVELRHGAEVLRGERLSGPGDLSSATLTPLRARGGSGARRWTLQASGGTWSRGGTIRLSTASGWIREQDREVRATADEVVYDPARQMILFNGNFKAVSESEAMRLTAERAEYDLRPPGTFRAFGNVQASVRGVAVKRGSWTYYLGRHPAGKVAEGGSPPAPRRDLRTREDSAPAKPKADSAPSVPPVEVKGVEAGATGTGDRPGAVGGQGP